MRYLAHLIVLSISQFDDRRVEYFRPGNQPLPWRRLADDAWKNINEKSDTTEAASTTTTTTTSTTTPRVKGAGTGRVQNSRGNKILRTGRINKIVKPEVDPLEKEKDQHGSVFSPALIFRSYMAGSKVNSGNIYTPRKSQFQSLPEQYYDFI